MARIRMIALSAAAFAGSAISMEPVWAQSRTEVIAQTGQAAPDGNGTYLSLFSGTINDLGQVAYTAALSGTSGGTSDFSGVFLGDGLSVTQIARRGQLVGGRPLEITNTNPSLTSRGQVGISGATMSGSFLEYAIYRGSGGALTQIVREGQSTPFFDGRYTTLDGFQPVFNNSGVAAFRSDLNATDGGTADNAGIFRGSGGAITQIARKGQSAPNGSGNFSFLRNPTINDAGQVAFQAELSGTTATSGVFRGNGTTLTQIARMGQASPDGNGILSIQGNAFINSTGQVAFSSRLTGTSGGAGDNDGIFRGNGGALTQVVRKGQFAPDANGAFSLFNVRHLNDAGQVSWEGSLSDTSGGTSDNRGIFRSSGGTVTQLFRKGEFVPNANGVHAGFEAIAFNNTGLAAVRSQLSGTIGGSSDDQGLFVSDGIDQLQVVREGESLHGSTVEFVLAEDGERFLNNHGQVAYKVQLTNGNTVLGRWTPDLRYRSTSSGTWDTTSRWTLGLNPAEVHDVFIDSAASLTVTGPATDTTVRSLQVGGGTGLATLSLRNGALLSATNGVTVASTGTLTGDGTIVGDVSNLGTVAANNVHVTGTLSNSGVIRGTGIVDASIVNGTSGKVRAIGGDQLRLSGASFINSGLVEINGGELQIDAQLRNESSTGLISIRNGTLIADSGIANQGSIAMTQGNSQIFGDITNLGGTIQVSGGAHATFYGDVIQTGVLQVASVGSTSSTAVFLGGFGGSGGFTGGGDLFVLGDLRPGDSPASVTFDGNLFLGLSTDTFIELGGPSPGEFDQMRVTGDLNLSGDLFVSLIDGHTLDFNQKYLVGDVGGTLLGRFNGLGEGDLVGIFGGYELFISYTAGSGNDIALFTAVPEPGTYLMLSTIALAVMVRRRLCTKRSVNGDPHRCDASVTNE